MKPTDDFERDLFALTDYDPRHARELGLDDDESADTHMPKLDVVGYRSANLGRGLASVHRTRPCR
jgi:hypothetical protein